MGFKVKAYQNRQTKFTLTLTDSAGNNIALSSGDYIAVKIGGDGSTPRLAFTSATPSSNGSRCTQANPTTVTLKAADMTFAPGVYDLEVDLYDASDSALKHLQTGELLLNGTET